MWLTRTRCASVVICSTTRVTCENQVVDELEPLVGAGGGLILDWHTCDAFPERWVDLVVVLQCNHTKLWDRLEARWVIIPTSLLRISKVNLLLQGLPVEKSTGEQ